MTWRRRLLVVAPAVIFVGTWPFVADQSDALALLTDAVTGLILIVAGLVAADRRPSGRTGPLLIAAGYLWYVGDLYFVFPVVPLVPLLSFAFRGYYDVVIAFLLLSFPSGRLQTRTQLIVIGALAFVYLVRSTAFLVMAVPGLSYPDDVFGNPFVLLPNAPLESFDAWITALKALLIAAVALLALVRWASASPPTRRVLAPVLVGGMGWALSSIIYDIGLWTDLTFGVRIPPWQDVAWWSIPDYLVRGAAAPIGFLVGALMLRTARSAVVDLVSGIADQPARRHLQDSLVKVLGDPTLVVLYPNGSLWADANGRAVEYPVATPERAPTPIESDGRTIAVIVHDSALLEDPGLVGAVAATARLAVDNERLELPLARSSRRYARRGSGLSRGPMPSDGA